MENKTGKKRVILVEDDPAIIDVYALAFKNSKVELEVINSGREAVRKIKEYSASADKKPALVLLDLILPDINGSEVLKAAKTDALSKDIPIFILSNQTSMDESQLNGAKPDNFIIKANLTPTQLVKMVEKKLALV